MKRAVVLVGILFLLAAGIWQFGLRPQFNQRFPDGWKWEVNTLGQTSYADEETGTFPENTTLADDPINLTFRTVTAEADGMTAGLVQITDHYEVRDPITNTVQWEFSTTAVVDAATGAYVDGEGEGDYYFLPKNPQKTTYRIRNSSYPGIPMEFQREEVVAGIPTYLYAFYGDHNNTLSYTDVELEPNQIIMCFDFELEYWVEPNTGEIIKYREWCEGDWVVDTETNERLYALSRWGGETGGDDLIRQSIEVQNILNQHRLVNTYIPLALFVAGVIALGFGLWPMFKRQPDSKVTAPA